MTVNIERRKKVIGRSRKLGHCVCNPKLPCPCPDFINYNICSCAGERPESRTKDAALTQYVRKAGCASKIGQADLLRILKRLPAVNDPNVLVGTAAGDDAGIYCIADGRALVQTVDVFTPCVDDPYLFGQIAAANSVSDVYAMGGRPISALSVIGFPIDTLDGSIMESILRGGIDKLKEARCSLIGGHSINDEEIKAGFAVTGLIDPEAVVCRDTPRPGDALVLTKPLGTGIICFAAQIGLVGAECLAETGAYMATLNRDAAELMGEYGASACTDVTGYGLMGHLSEMVGSNGYTAEIDLPNLPVFAAAVDCLANDIIPGAVERNQEYSMARVVAEDGDCADMPILFDPQTSGGLLIALPSGRADAFVETLAKKGHTAVAVIGRIVDDAGPSLKGKVLVRGNAPERLIGRHEAVSLTKRSAAPATSQASATTAASAVFSAPAVTTMPAAVHGNVPDGPALESCCDSPPGLDGDEGPDGAGSPDIPASFSAFMKAVNDEGRIDRKTKKLMAIALSVAEKCRPCLVIHIKSALAMGITKAEIEEAAYMGISFAGCPSLMVYKDVCGELNLHG